MPLGTRLNVLLGALQNEIPVNIMFPVLGTTGKLVHLTGYITDVGDDYVRLSSKPAGKSEDFYEIPISSITAVTNDNPPVV